MRHESPLRNRHEAWIEREGAELAGRVDAAGRGDADASAHRPELELLPYGPSSDDVDGQGVEVVATLGSVELEYAAIRRGVGLLDAPHRATLEITGSERIEFLERMVTGKLADIADGDVRASFWLNRKGRIEADLLLIALGDRLLVDVDVHQAARVIETLDAFVFSEDVTIRDRSPELAQLRVHGSSAVPLLASFIGTVPAEDRAVEAEIVGVPCAIARCDETAAPGFIVVAPRARLGEVWDALLAEESRERHRARPIGWLAWNIARIEGGTPVFNIDFGTESLPHETGVLRERVSFTKGCYLGQEVVARMESLGKPKQRLVLLRIEADRLPVAGAQVFAPPPDGGAVSLDSPIGVVTSSTLAPMLGAAPIAFAMVRSKHVTEGGRVMVNAEGEQVSATMSLDLGALEAPRSRPTTGGAS